MPIPNIMDELINKLELRERQREDAILELKAGEIMLLVTALKMYDAIDDVLDDRLNLNKQHGR